MTSYYKTRINIVFVLALSAYIILIINLYGIQMRRSDFFESLGRRQYSFAITALPERASIFDRFSKPLTLNILQPTAFILPRQLDEPEKTKRFLKRYFPAAAERLEKYKDHYFMYVKRHLTQEEIDLITRNKIDDIRFLKEPERFYPVESLGTIVGMTDSDNNGLFGIEAYYNKLLAGKPSRYVLEQEARSGHYYFSKQMQVEGNEGASITLTLDSTLHFLVHDELKKTVEQLKAHEGCVLIMDPSTGDILTMAQYPDINPNDRVKLDLEKTKNKIVTEAYEFGSVMKVFLALAALEEGVIMPEDLVDCEGKLSAVIDGMKVSTLHPHGVLTFSQVIELSNNIGTSKVAKLIGPKLYDHYTRCGFGQKTDLNFPGEQRGFVNPPYRWSKRSIFSLSFGYEVRATLVQLAAAFSLLANNGVPVKPRLILKPDLAAGNLTRGNANKFDDVKTSSNADKNTLGSGDKSVDKNISAIKPLYKAKTVAAMREILKRTVSQGTAKKAAIAGYDIIGKTGTANLIVDGHYDENHEIFTFTGLVEKGNYKRVVVTFVKEVPEKLATAASVAVPLFDRVVRAMLIHEKII